MLVLYRVLWAVGTYLRLVAEIAIKSKERNEKRRGKERKKKKKVRGKPFGCCVRRSTMFQIISSLRHVLRLLIDGIDSRGKMSYVMQNIRNLCMCCRYICTYIHTYIRHNNKIGWSSIATHVST